MAVTDHPPVSATRRIAPQGGGRRHAPDQKTDLAADEKTDRAVQILGVVGWTTRGLVYLIVAGIVLKVAWSGGAEPQTPTKTGVLNTLVERTGGTVLVGLLALGAVAYVLVRVAPLVLSRSGSSWQQRGQAAAAAIIYLPLAYSAVRLMTGGAARQGPAGNERETNGIGGWLLQSTWGKAVLVIGGLALLGYAGYQLYKGRSGRFLRSLELDEVPLPNAVVRGFGAAGFATRGVIAGLLGGFAVWAARADDATSVHSVDGMLRTVLGWSFGPGLLTAIAAGLVGFAAYCWCAAAARPHEEG